MNKNQYYLHCQYIMGILAVKIKIINEQLMLRHKREVIQNVSQRIKSPESIYAKMIRKNLKPDFDLAKEKLNDLIGIRIVCLFLDDVYEIADMLNIKKNSVRGCMFRARKHLKKIICGDENHDRSNQSPPKRR